MKHRRNLGVAAVTAAVVTTALVGTTLPDLMADRTSDSTQQQEGTAAESVVTTELPDVPSAKDISDAKESSQATDQMITEINEQLSQANQRALELEASLQMEQEDALAADEQAREAARAADEAEEASEEAESAAADEYQDGETSAEDVLLSEDEDALAEAATEDQLTEQAEDDADAAAQDADEADALASQAEDAARANTQAQDDLNNAQNQTATDYTELGETVRDLLESGAELEGYEDLSSYYALVLGNADLVDENGEVDTEALGWHIATLRDDAAPEAPSEEDPADEEPSDEDETADGSAEGEEGEASPSADPEANEVQATSTNQEEEAADEENEEELSEESVDSDEADTEGASGPSHTLSQYLPGTRALVEQLAELEDASISETFQQLLEDSDFTTDSGLLDHAAVNAEVNRLAPSPSDSSSDSEEASEAENSSETENSSEADSSSDAGSSSESDSSPSPSASPSPSQSASPSQSPSPTQSSESSEPVSVHSLSDYQSGTTGLVERIAELSDESASAAFDRLIDDSDFTDSNGHLNHAALQREVNRLAPSPSPSPSQSSGGSSSSDNSSSESESDSSSSNGSSESGSSDDESDSSSSSESSSSESSSAPSHSLGQYREGTRSLVEQIAELNGDGVSATFSRLAGSSDFTDSNGVLDHSALQSEVSRLSPSQSQESSSSGGGSSSNSGANNEQSSGSSSGSPDVSAGAGSGAAQIAASWARGKVGEAGTHYVLGANGPKAWDCSSLTQQAMAQAGVSIPRTSQAQFNGGQAVSLNNLQVGDLVFWGGNSSIYHVAIYIGGGQIAHARNPQSGLTVTSVNYAFQSPNPTAKRYF